LARKRVRRQPQRSCVACRRVGDKRDLVRIVRTPEGRVALDLKGKVPGRGAYVCRNRNCWLQARNRGAIGRALSVTPCADDLAAIDTFFEQLSDEHGTEG